MMTLEQFDQLLFPNGKKEPIYSNMVGQDHLIKSIPTYSKDIECACKKAKDDFDVELLPYNDIEEYQICYFKIQLMRIKDYKEQLDFIYSHSSIAKSWMTTDLCNKHLKHPSFDIYKPYFFKFIKLDGVYQRRFAYVLALKFAKDKAAVELFLNNIIDDDNYYVYMSEAWLIAGMGIYYFDLVKDFLINSHHSIILKKKAISKMIDSYRISDKQKEELKKIRNEL